MNKVSPALMVQTEQVSFRGGLPIALTALGKRFGERTVLDSCDLNIPGGQFIAIIGRSGCGKSTLLRLIAGLEAPSGGRVEIGGTSSAGIRADVRLLFQEARLLPWQRVVANVGLTRGTQLAGGCAGGARRRRLGRPGQRMAAHFVGRTETARRPGTCPDRPSPRDVARRTLRRA